MLHSATYHELTEPTSMVEAHNMATPRLLIPVILKSGLVLPQNDTPLPEGAGAGILIGPAEMTPE